MSFIIILIVIIILTVLACLLYRTVQGGCGECSYKKGGCDECGNKKGGAKDIALDVLKLIKPYLQEKNNQDNFEQYLENYYEYTRTEIRNAKRKSKDLYNDVGKKNAYLYYLISDIIDKNRYDSAYEMLYDAEVDYSSFVDEDDINIVRKLSKKYTKKEQNDIKKIVKKMGLDFSARDFSKFLMKNKYFIKKGKKIIPDVVALMIRAWDYFREEPIVPEIIKVTPKKTLLTILKDDRREEELLRNQRRLLLEKDLERRQKENLARERQQLIREKVEREKEYDASQFEMHKRMFKDYLINNPEYTKEIKERRDRGEPISDIFDEWRTTNPIIVGSDDVKNNGEKISKEEVEEQLEQILTDL